MQDPENWVLVQDVSELKPAMMVKLVRCRYCAVTHYGVLIRFILRSRSLDDGTIKSAWVWTGTCSGAYASGLGRAAQERRLYRFDTGQSDEEQQREGRDLYRPTRVREPLRSIS